MPWTVCGQSPGLTLVDRLLVVLCVVSMVSVLMVSSHPVSDKAGGLLYQKRESLRAEPVHPKRLFSIIRAQRRLGPFGVWLSDRLLTPLLNPFGETEDLPLGLYKKPTHGVRPDKSKASEVVLEPDVDSEQLDIEVNGRLVGDGGAEELTDHYNQEGRSDDNLQGSSSGFEQRKGLPGDEKQKGFFRDERKNKFPDSGFDDQDERYNQIIEAIMEDDQIDAGKYDQPGLVNNERKDEVLKDDDQNRLDGDDEVVSKEGDSKLSKIQDEQSLGGTNNITKGAILRLMNAESDGGGSQGNGNGIQDGTDHSSGDSFLLGSDQETEGSMSFDPEYTYNRGTVLTSIGNMKESPQQDLIVENELRQDIKERPETDKIAHSMAGDLDHNPPSNIKEQDSFSGKVSWVDSIPEAKPITDSEDTVNANGVHSESGLSLNDLASIRSSSSRGTDHLDELSDIIHQAYKASSARESKVDKQVPPNILNEDEKQPLIDKRGYTENVKANLKRLKGENETKPQDDNLVNTHGGNIDHDVSTSATVVQVEKVTDTNSTDAPVDNRGSAEEPQKEDGALNAPINISDKGSKSNSENLDKAPNQRERRAVVDALHQNAEHIDSTDVGNEGKGIHVELETTEQDLGGRIHDAFDDGTLVKAIGEVTDSNKDERHAGYVILSGRYTEDDMIGEQIDKKRAVNSGAENENINKESSSKDTNDFKSQEPGHGGAMARGKDFAAINSVRYDGLSVPNIESGVQTKSAAGNGEKSVQVTGRPRDKTEGRETTKSSGKSDYEIREDSDDDDYDDGVEQMEFKRRRRGVVKRGKLGVQTIAWNSRKDRHDPVSSGFSERRQTQNMKKTMNRSKIPDIINKHNTGEPTAENRDADANSPMNRDGSPLQHKGNGIAHRSPTVKDGGLMKKANNHTFLEDADVVFIVRHKPTSKGSHAGVGQHDPTDNHVASTQTRGSGYNLPNILNNAGSGKDIALGPGKTSRHVPNVDHTGIGAESHEAEMDKENTKSTRPSGNGPLIQRVTRRPLLPHHPHHLHGPHHMHPSAATDLAWKRRHESGRQGAALLCFLSLTMILFIVLILALTKTASDAAGPSRNDSNTALYVNYPHY